MKHVVCIIGCLLVGCASVPSPQASRVKEADDRMVANCELLGTIVGSSLIGGVVDTGAINSMVSVKEQAAAQGATHVVFSGIDGGNQFATGRATARAYRCH
jgi:hypothetical protein